jgi:hypothetical protein
MSKGQGQFILFCTGVGEERIWASEGEESTLLEATARERLVKSLQIGEDIACKVWTSRPVLTVICSYDL